MAKSIEDDRNTALHIAAEKGEQKIIPLLLSKGTDASDADNLGQTPLHRAVRFIYPDGGQVGIVFSLVKAPPNFS